MKLFRKPPILALLALVLMQFGSTATRGHSHESLPNFDRRQAAELKAAARPSPEQGNALRGLKGRVPGLDVDFSPVVGSPQWVQARQGFLSGPNGRGRALGPEAARAFDAKDRDRSVKAFLREHQALFGHGPEALLPARRMRDYVTEHNQMRTVVWKQQLDGIPVHEAVFIANVTAKGELVNLSSQFVPDLERAADAGAPGRGVMRRLPRLSPKEALLLAAENIGESVSPDQVVALRGESGDSGQRYYFQAGDLPGEAHAGLIWLPMDRSRMRLCWAVEVTRRHRGERFRLLIDARDGTVHLRRGLTFDLSEVTYRVFTGASPSPFAPGHSAPSREQPPIVERELITLSALNTNASPVGWISPGVNETRGNNVDAYLDHNADNRPDLPRPQAAPGRVFDFPVDFSRSPTHYAEAAVVQLFYWCNWMHDRLYELGFTEAAGNFQKDNFGRGGLGGDPMLAEAQDGSGFNNANYTAAPDGTSPRIQMFLFDGAEPWRDSSFDAEVILHEYAHGLTDRLVGGGVGISGGNQAFGLAEGWSDFYALALLSEPDQDVDATYAYGGYMTYGFSGLRENYYFGIRRYPYTTDRAKNPLTFQHTYEDDAIQFPHIPRNPIITSTGQAVHRMGEVWCTVLWEARASLIRKYGFSEGNELILQLVTDGLKLSPPNPNFIQARDAILKADEVNHGGANLEALWAAFARRGMGISARTSDHWLSGGWAVEAFDLPGLLTLGGGGPLVVSGPDGGPFAPSSQSYVVINSGLEDLDWAVQDGAEWLEVTPPGGRIETGRSDTVTLALTPAAALLPTGVYSNAVLLANAGSTVATQMVVLRVGQLDWVTQVFKQNSFNLDNLTLTFTPDGSPSYYSVCLSPALEFPTNPAGGEAVRVADDSYDLIHLSGGAEISLFGTRSNQFLIGSNGDIVLEPPSYYTYDEDRGIYTEFFRPGLPTFFERLRVGALYSDLNPDAGGTVTWKELPDRVAVTYEDVPEYGRPNASTFQVELFFDGAIRFTYLGVTMSDAIVGLSRGTGPEDFLESNLSAADRCYPPLKLALPPRAEEGGPPVRGMVTLAEPAAIDLVVRLQSGDPDILTVEPLLIPPGNVSGIFQIQVPDDDLLTGTRHVTITAFAEGHDPDSGVIEVFDNETASLTVTLPPMAREGDGLLSRQGLVEVDAVPDGAVVVRLTSTHPDLVQVPAEAIIAAGEMSARFDLRILKQPEFSTGTAVTVLAFVQNWESGSSVITVSDNKTRQLALFLPGRIGEADGTLIRAGRVEIAGVLETNLPVHLASDSPGLLQVPATVMLAAGERSAHFDVTLIDDDAINGDRPVLVSAAAPGFVSANSAVLVEDDESPSTPTEPGPAHTAGGVATETLLSWRTERPEFPEGTLFEVYFGTNPAPAGMDFLGATPQTDWSLPVLELGTSYYWQIVAQKGPVRMAGPVWKFTTVELSHFEITIPPGPHWVGAPFEVTVAAKDENMNTATAFNHPVLLTGLVPGPTDSAIVITEVDTGRTSRLEFANVSGRDLEISGWEVTLYDWVSWPDPRTAFTIPHRTMSLAGDVFVLRRSAPQVVPGEYPLFEMGPDISWNNIFIGNPVAVLLRDAEGNVVDFMCAVDADPTQITEPLPIPPEHWTGGPVPGKRDTALSYQRIGKMDRNNAMDWAIGTTNLAELNPDLGMPFIGYRPVLLSTHTLSHFDQGIWTGPVSVPEVASEIFLQATDARGHSGTGTVFSIAAPDDLSVTLETAPATPRVGADFTYTMSVSNSGPSAATGVVLRMELPGAAAVVEAGTEQGSCLVVGGEVICDLGSLEADAAVLVTVTVRPTAARDLRSVVEVTRAEPESYLANNMAVSVASVEYPWLDISPVRLMEGTTTTNAVFPVRLSHALSETVTVNFHSSDGTGIAGVDYVGTDGTLTFPPGTTQLHIPVTVIGNTVRQPNRTFFVHLHGAENAVVGSSPGIGTIIDDDFFGGIPVTISDVTVVEGDEGLTETVFDVTLKTVPEMPVIVAYETADGTATAGLDYIPTHGRLTFDEGVTNKTITVYVIGDTLIEPDETFHVRLTAVRNASLSRSQGVGTIVDDDEDQLHRFVWNLPEPPLLAYAPFAAGVAAVDKEGRTVTEFDSRVQIRAGRNAGEIEIGTGTGTPWAYPMGASFEDARLQVVYLAEEMGGAGLITGLALDAPTLPGQILKNWTIRLKHSPLVSFRDYAWEESGWTQVYQADQTFASPGWISFYFQKPFFYNGVDHLMVDFSFSNSDSSKDGLVRWTAASDARAVGYRTDSAFGNPLHWNSSTPPPQPMTRFPNVRFSMETPVAVTPPKSGDFVDGKWTGEITFLDFGSDVFLFARDDQGRVGVSNPFQLTYVDSDGDGLPDEWEKQHGLDPNDPTDAFLDLDGDGMTNWEEFLAGTNPHDPESVLRINELEVSETTLTLTFPSVSGRRYVLEGASSLRPESWTALSGVVPGTGEPWSFTISVDDGEPQFYRVKLVR